MTANFTTSVRMMVILMVLVSGIYPMLVWGIGQLCFKNRADGSLIRGTNGQVIGSALIAQSFSKPTYFHPRPSAAGSGYDPTASGGTNLGPTSDKLINGIPDTLSSGKPNPNGFDGIKTLALIYREDNGLALNAPVPVDAVSRSASGLDPDISITNADLQDSRVAKARGMTVQTVRRLIRDSTRRRALGILGEPGVNVLLLNLALDKAAQSSKLTARAR